MNVKCGDIFATVIIYNNNIHLKKNQNILSSVLFLKILRGIFVIDIMQIALIHRLYPLLIWISNMHIYIS